MEEGDIAPHTHKTSCWLFRSVHPDCTQANGADTRNELVQLFRPGERATLGVSAGRSAAGQRLLTLSETGEQGLRTSHDLTKKTSFLNGITEFALMFFVESNLIHRGLG